MADWSRPFTASYRFVRVSRETGMEVGRLPQFRSGGSITRNIDTQTFESAEAPFVGSLDVGADLVRVYLDATFYETGETATAALGTFLANVPSRSVENTWSESTAKLDGRLKELAEDAFDVPVTVPKGSNAVEEARSIAVGCGLSVEADSSSYELSADWTFGLSSSADADGGSKLDAVNALLDLAGFSAARTDPMGTVLMRRYEPPADRSPSARLAEGPGSRLVASAEEEADSTEVANVVHAIYETDGGTVIGEAVDDDPASPYSTASLGRRRVANYTYSDEVSQKEADAKASELLATQQSVVHRVTVSHPYMEIACGDVAELDYPSAGISGRFAVRAQTLTMGAGCMVKDEARAFSR